MMVERVSELRTLTGRVCARRGRPPTRLVFLDKGHQNRFYFRERGNEFKPKGGGQFSFDSRPDGLTCRQRLAHPGGIRVLRFHLGIWVFPSRFLKG